MQFSFIVYISFFHNCKKLGSAVDKVEPTKNLYYNKNNIHIIRVLNRWHVHQIVYVRYLKTALSNLVLSPTALQMNDEKLFPTQNASF